jgi:nucleoid DNA-binding protein
MTTKRDIVNHIAEETGLTQMEVKRVVQSTFDYIFNTLVQGGKLELRNFGVFQTKVRKARQGRNPNKPETVIPVPAKTVPTFKPGKLLKHHVAQGIPAPQNPDDD